MGVFLFGCHAGHLGAKADRIAHKHGAEHVNHTEPHGRRCGWFEAPNRGEPFNGARANGVWRDIDKAGGLDALRHKQDREETP